jgi:hypothetical protein
MTNIKGTLTLKEKKTMIDNNEFYSHAVYEVLDENTHKYASTSVSGGGSNGTGGRSAVSSNTTYHSDQDVWVKNIETEKERKLELRTFNIDVRPGHKLLCVTNKKTKLFERVINLDTDTVYYGESKLDAEVMKPNSIFKISFVTLLSTLIMLIPIVNAVFLRVALERIFVSQEKRHNERWVSPKITGTIFLVLSLSVFILGIVMINSKAVTFGPFYILSALITCVYMVKFGSTDRKNLQFHYGNIEKYINDYFALNQSKALKNS